ncbi:hypothetical protein QBC33DRAFT_558331 [Phialemonium atrogriseum]|uniref:Uncharacterized protein n=1 Tax=Phialemonium atrogriseum TaxID=1093897 RepID=A0AAJ0C284_9PEZI|nr:uncharacterized protein QBC33DRAFT_558331 [Phialemonium atrogriseum]KAK1768167.1 hypothetical protein QBC33DRAFT_558331 [Phialemonium atrogriseum]
METNRAADDESFGIVVYGLDFLARFSPITGPLKEHFADGSYQWRPLRSYLRSDLERVVESDDWNTICPHRIGYGNDYGEDDGDELILLFTVRPESTTATRAAEIVRQARLVLGSHDVRLSNMAVEVAEADIQPATSNFLRRPPFGLGQGYDDTYCENPPPDASIGIDGCASSGSVGAYVRITFQDGCIDHFAWTNHHVLSQSADVIPPTGQGLIVNCPSDPDHKSFCEMFRIFQSEGLSQHNVIQPASQLVKECCDFDRMFGSVFCSSGLRCGSDNYIMDWALIKLANQRFPSFQHLTNIPSENVFLQYVKAS